ncbi:MFS transporter [Cryobacterium sp. RTS3]|uniref:MFS transporter n=1 Tax=Cryobacterium sp. RTS3 TaxID=3048643 RepID=UPI002B230613|nr:MFS transporter [Cryobacterium sp. RTS3]MEA9999847.1 MFS transporter [Cryobacterium sp. RTS3]
MAGIELPGSDGVSARRQRNIALLVAGTFFMEILDGTILTTAAPQIGRAFGVASVDVGVAITAYLLTLAVLIPLSGWITARFGARRVFLTAIAVFTVASILCAASPSLLLLTLSRVLQGAGGAMMVPVGRLAVLRVTAKGDLIRAIALLTWPALAAPVIAPLAGGLITTYTSWHWIFLINVPLGIVAFFAARVLVPGEEPVSPPALDWAGLWLSCSALGSLILAASLLSAPVPDWPALLALASAGAALGGLAVRHLRRARHPLLDLDALRIETFRVAHAGGWMFRLTISAVPFLLPLLFQDAFGWSPVLAGSLVLALFAGNMAIKPVTTPLLRRFGFRRVLLSATTGAALSMALAALLTVETPVVIIVVLMVFSGVVRSVGFTGYNTIAFADVGRGQMTAANTLASTLQQLAAGFGIACGAIALRAGSALVGADALGALGAGSEAFRIAFLLLALLTVPAVVEAWRLSPGAGENIRPSRQA